MKSTVFPQLHPATNYYGTTLIARIVEEDYARYTNLKDSKLLEQGAHASAVM